MQVVFCRPNENATIETIEGSFDSIKQAVNGRIEAFCPFSDRNDPRIENIVLVCNADNKNGGYDPCRLLVDSDSNIADIIFGSFFLCYGPEDEFISLPDDLARKIQSKFYYPDVVIETQ